MLLSAASHGRGPEVQSSTPSTPNAWRLRLFALLCPVCDCLLCAYMRIMTRSTPPEADSPEHRLFTPRSFLYYSAGACAQNVLSACPLQSLPHRLGGDPSHRPHGRVLSAFRPAAAQLPVLPCAGHAAAHADDAGPGGRAAADAGACGPGRRRRRAGRPAEGHHRRARGACTFAGRFARCSAVKPHARVRVQPAQSSPHCLPDRKT